MSTLRKDGSFLSLSENVFQERLKRLELVTWYVANGHGIGVNIALPELVSHVHAAAHRAELLQITEKSSSANVNAKRLQRRGPVV